MVCWGLWCELLSLRILHHLLVWGPNVALAVVCILIHLMVGRSVVVLGGGVVLLLWMLWVVRWGGEAEVVLGSTSTTGPIVVTLMVSRPIGLKLVSWTPLQDLIILFIIRESGGQVVTWVCSRVAVHWLLWWIRPVSWPFLLLLWVPMNRLVEVLLLLLWWGLVGWVPLLWVLLLG